MPALAYLARAAALTAADRVVCSPLYRWTWRPLTEEAFVARVPEIRPTDSLSASDMVAGKYLLGARLVETGGVSPFSVDSADTAWKAELHGFAWLRHFAEAPDAASREFAATLVLDWIGRFGHFDRTVWRNALAARRVQNWLIHYELITAGASDRQRRTIGRCLSAQIHALSQRGGLDPDPLGRLGAATALVAVALSLESGRPVLPRRVGRLARMLDEQLDRDGLHRTRSARNQFELLAYLVPVRLALVKAAPEAARTLFGLIDRMHEALAAQTLTTGEPAYFNGTGQLPLETLLAVQSHGNQRAEGPYARVRSGYGQLRQGRAKLIADGGAVPVPAYSRQIHAGALSFEFSWGNELVVCNCGPAPGQLDTGTVAFRISAAHSTLDMPDISAVRFGRGPLLAGLALARARAPAIRCLEEDATVQMGSAAYVRRYGLRFSRALSLIDDGQSLIGQDVLSHVGGGVQSIAHRFTLRFHLAPGSRASAESGQSLIRVVMQNGDGWVFLWEGAEAAIEPSVRQSIHYGLVDTEQIVLTGRVAGRQEIAWSFARQVG